MIFTYYSLQPHMNFCNHPISPIIVCSNCAYKYYDYAEDIITYYAQDEQTDCFVSRYHTQTIRIEDLGRRTSDIERKSQSFFFSMDGFPIYSQFYSRLPQWVYDMARVRI